jgi:hypothetical protein
MKLVALVDLRVPEGAVPAGQSFQTTADIAARVIAGGYARPEGDEPPVATREPEVTHRDPRRRKK